MSYAELGNEHSRRTTTPPSATYIRTQIAIALAFLGWLEDQGVTLATTNQAHLDLWLTNGRQTNYILAPFISWARARGLCDLTVPQRPHTDPATFLEPADSSSMLRRCLYDQDLPMDVRAAGVLVLLFGRTTTSFNHLTVGDIHGVAGETYLRLDGFDALLPPAAADLFHALRDTTTDRETFHRADPTTRYLFPGRSPGKPMPGYVLGRKLRAHGISGLPARNSARVTWAQTIPSPIAADLLGINISTATKWASRTQSDWNAYIAARAQANRSDSGQH